LSDIEAHFNGTIEWQWLVGPFFAELVVSNYGIDIRPRLIRMFKAKSALKSDIIRITVGSGWFHPPVRFETISGWIDSRVFILPSSKHAMRLRKELIDFGYPPSD
jgi:hypothetical protein